MKDIVSKYLKVKQPIGEFYVITMKCSELMNIARNDIRRIEKDDKYNDIYYGIQREPSPSRLKEISEYVTYSDATYPSCIVICINKSSDDNISHIKIDGDNLIIESKAEAQIIDGQHRLLGLKKALDNSWKGSFEYQRINDFDIIVTLFLDLDMESNSMIFSTINKAQTKVNKSLVYDLYDLAKAKSPYKSAHTIVRVLNENDNSPFKNLIKMLGTADSSEEMITQAALVESIVNYISKKPMDDRNRFLENKPIEEYSNEKNRYIFRNYYRKDMDVEIAVILIKFFSAVKETFDSWGNKEFITSKSTGVIAFIRLLGDIIVKKESYILTKGDYSEIILPAKEKIIFTNENYPSGKIGQNKLYMELKLLCGL